VPHLGDGPFPETLAERIHRTRLRITARTDEAMGTEDELAPHVQVKEVSLQR
jgi:hypothetical protein